MNSQTLSNISYILLASGIVMLILSIFLSVKFNLIGMLRAEFGRNKRSPVFEGRDDDPPTLGSSFSKCKIEEHKVFEDKITEEKHNFYETGIESDITGKFESENLNEIDSETVMISSKKDVSDSDATIVISNKKNTDVTTDEFCIIDDIMVFHGDPYII